VNRSDLVVVHAPRYGASGHGLFIVDSVAGNVVKVLAPSHAGAVAGADKSQTLVLDKTTDILAVHTASSISA
jgi:hypothetical protein